MFEVELYETEDGKTPVQDFLDSLDYKMRAKLHMLISLLEEKGNALRMPYTEAIEDGIFQLRASQGNDIARALFFFFAGGRIVITNGFIKKTPKTPRSEIDLAKARREDYYSRRGKEKENAVP